MNFSMVSFLALFCLSMAAVASADAVPPADPTFTPPTASERSQYLRSAPRGKGGPVPFLPTAAVPTGAAETTALSRKSLGSRQLNGVFIICERQGSAPTAKVYSGSTQFATASWPRCTKGYVQGYRPGTSKLYNHALLWPFSGEEFNELKTYYESQYACRGRGTVYVLRRFWRFWWPIAAVRLSRLLSSWDFPQQCSNISFSFGDWLSCSATRDGTRMLSSSASGIRNLLPAVWRSSLIAFRADMLSTG